MNNILYNFSDLFWGEVGIISGVISVALVVLSLIKKKPKSNKNKNKISLIIGIVMGLLYTLTTIYKNNLVETPNVIGMIYGDAYQTLTKKNLKVAFNVIDNHDECIVIEQSIPEGSIVRKKEYVYLTLQESNETTETSDNSGDSDIFDNSFDDDYNWSIKLLNNNESPTIIGTDLIFDLDINTPKSQYSTPYILYAAYYDKHSKTQSKWEHFLGLNIPAKHSHILLTLDTYLMGIPADDYLFKFDLYRSNDFNTDKSHGSVTAEVKLIGDNQTFDDDIFHRGIYSYEFIDYYTIHNKKYPQNTTQLSLTNVTNKDIESIACLTELTYLHLTGSEITDIAELRNLSRLESLSIFSNNLSNISGIEDMTNLKHLSICSEDFDSSGIHSFLKDISPIVNLKNLNSLIILDCRVRDIRYIENLKNLKYLYISKTEVEDISFLGNLQQVKKLKLNDNNINDITPLNGLPNLTSLTISNNNLSDQQIDDFKEANPNCYVYCK